MIVRGFLIAAALGAAVPSNAEVTISDTGFSTNNSATVAATPAEAWAALIEPARYWNPDHRWGGDAAALSLEPRAGGCFCETLPNDGSVEHMRVVMVRPGQMLRLSGALGPLQSEGLAGALTWLFEPVDGGTRITQTYSVGGHMQFEREVFGPIVDGVLREQLDRLVALFPATD
jgi:hypothetical protein